MKDWALYITFSTLRRECNIKMLNSFWRYFFYSSYKKTITCNGECILSKKRNYHSSSTMQSCKLWHYLCWHRGKKWRRKAGPRWRWGRVVGNKEKRANPHTNTRPSALSQWGRLGLALSSRACQIYFQHQETLCCFQPHPSVPRLVFLCGQSRGQKLRVET